MIYDPSPESAAVVDARNRLIQNQRASRLAGELARARRGDPKDQYALGLDYLRDPHDPDDPLRAVQWLKRAANGGSVDAMYVLGTLYAGTSPYYSGKAFVDPQKAVEWLAHAANAGNMHASIALASLYAEGKRVPKDEARAELWLRRAAAANGKDDIFCWPPEAFTPAMRKEALTVCAVNHPPPPAPLPIGSRTAAYPPQAEFDLMALLPTDRAALTQAVLSAVSGKVAAAYPPRADDNDVEGWGEVDCWWNGNGGLERCRPVDEAPPGYGFAKAAAGLLDGVSGLLPGTHSGTWSRLRLNWRLQ